MSKSFFLDLVEKGMLPKPIRLRGVRAWDRLKLDAAVDTLDLEPPSRDRDRKLADEAMGITTEDD